MTPAVLTGFLLLVVSICTAQPTKEFVIKTASPYPYEIGVSIGRSQYFGDLYEGRSFISSGSNWGAYGLVRRQIKPAFTLRGNVLIGRLTARDRDNPSGLWNYRSMKFTTPLLEVAGLIEWYPLVKNANGRLSPYFFAGVGGLVKHPVVSRDSGATSSPSDSILAIDASRTKRVALVLPVGFGFSYALTATLKVGMEVGYRFSFSDYLDGFHEASYGNSKHKDSYLVASVLLVYRLRNKSPNTNDADNDGVIDAEDTCPDEFGDPATCGCPDDDQDGIPNSCDCCPNEKGERAYHGCTKAHNIEYTHTRMPARMRYCPLCPPDLLNAHRMLKTNPSNLIHKTR